MKINIKTISFINGIILCGLSLVTCIPMLCDVIFFSGEYVYVFAPSALVCLFFGITTIISCKLGEVEERKNLSRHDVFLLVTSIWIVVPLASAFPFYVYKDVAISFMSALFEATSGLTTTGFSIYADVESLPFAVNMWRMILHFIGGVGIVAIAIVALPVMKIGGMQLFLTENSDKSKKFLPRSSQIAALFVGVYVAIICIFALWLHFAGMGVFDAVFHSISAVATGGFSTKNSGIAFFDSSYITFIVSLGMLVGGLTFIEVIKFFRNGFRGFFQNQQTNFYLLFVSVLALVVIIISFFHDEKNVSWANAANCFFDILSCMTTTGFPLQSDFCHVAFFQAMLLLITLLGACSGSTSGGIKIFRVQILFSIVKCQLQKLSNPFNVSLPKYQNENISDSVSTSVVSFCVLFVLLGAMSIIFLTMTGISGSESSFAVVNAICNAGQTIDVHSLNGFAEFVLIVDMLIGRLEIVPILILVTRAFWQHSKT